MRLSRRLNRVCRCVCVCVWRNTHLNTTEISNHSELIADYKHNVVFTEFTITLRRHHSRKRRKCGASGGFSSVNRGDCSVAAGESSALSVLYLTGARVRALVALETI